MARHVYVGCLKGFHGERADEHELLRYSRCQRHRSWALVNAATFCVTYVTSTIRYDRRV